MAALKENGIELMRAEIYFTPPSAIGELGYTDRYTYSIRSNGAIMRRADRRWEDDPAYRRGAWKRYKKIAADRWRKIDRRAYVLALRDRLIAGAWKILIAPSSELLDRCDRRVANGTDQRGSRW